MGYEVIKVLAKRKGISLETIAKNAGISYNSLSKIVRNTISAPKYSTMKSIAHSLGMNSDELSDAIGADSIASGGDMSINIPLTPTGQRIGRAYDVAPPPTQRIVEVTLEPYMSDGGLKKITPSSQEDAEFAEDMCTEPEPPVLREYTQSVAAGLGNYLDSDDYELVSFPGAPKRANIAVRISGDSMEPDYHDGDIVFVETDSVLRDGEIGIFSYNGEGLIKKLRLNPLRLVSLNPAYKDMHIKRSDDMQLYTIGRVVGRAGKEV